MSPTAERRAPLPIDDVLATIVDAVRQRGTCVVVAPPGSGKTTRVAPALLDAGLAGTGQVLMLQPRRVAARLSARRIAWERGGEVGGEVGYKIRFEDKTSRSTRLVVLTEGLLTRRLVADPLLLDASIVVLDEFHERSQHTDLCFAMLAELRRTVRDDLRIVVMSATLDPGPAAAFLGDAPIVRAEGRAFPVSLAFDPRPATAPLPERVARSVIHQLNETPSGHVLAFLPGTGEIRRAEEQLATLAAGDEGISLRGVTVLPLHGRLTGPEQDRALAPTPGRKVVLATNVAETSVTLDGVVAVVDSGLVRQARFEAGLGLDRLELVPISRASADQRAGRAGRTGPGRCRRLWTEAEDHRRIAFDTPEVRRHDLAPVLLDLLAWGVDPQHFPWFDAPPRQSVDAGMALLRRLDAVRDGAITDVGRRLAAIPAHPRFGRVLLEAQRRGVLASAATVAALVESGDPFLPDEIDPSDPIGDRLFRLADAEGRGRAPRGADRGAWERLRRTRDQLLRAAEAIGEFDGPGDEHDDDALVHALLAGLPDRLCVRRSPGSDRLRRIGDQGAVLDRRCPLPGHETLLALDLDVQDRASEPKVRLALPVPLSALPVVDEVQLGFDEDRHAVGARRVRAAFGLMLEDLGATAIPDMDAASRLLVEHAADRPELALRPSEDVRRLRSRMVFLRRVRPELELPPVPSWLELLHAAAPGRRSFEELRRVDLHEVLLRGWTWQQRKILDDEAPEAISVPSGASIPLEWPEEGAGQPVLAARIQQLFGQKESPRVAAGRVAVVIHLLAPSGRPQQVTADLRSFWAGAYLEVRKELRARYPKHPWPEDPTLADATDRARRRA